MTNMPEAKLAREAELCYATVAMVTDYDSWHAGHGTVDVAVDHRGGDGNSGNAARLVGDDRRDFPRRARALPARLATGRSTSRS